VPGQIVDTPAAQEFMAEVLAKAGENELVATARLLEAKRDGFQRILGDGRAARASATELRCVLRSIFSSRRHADDLLAAVGTRELAVAVGDLLDGDGDVSERFERFDDVIGDAAGVGFDLPGELLHFTYPDRHWLWTRWMWDPSTETGALRLVTAEEFDLVADGRGATYLAVGQAVAVVEETGKAVGFTALGQGLLGTDVFLAAVYGIYMYTVLRMRMTQEFNRIVPPLPDLVRRLLGVRALEV
jgi:hypothetical protein